MKHLRIAGLLFVLLLSRLSAYAYTDWSDGWSTFKWNASKGVIECRFTYFSWDGGSLSGHCGFAKDENSSGATLVVGGQMIRFNCSTNGGLNVISKPGTIASIQEERSGAHILMVFEVPILASQINTTVGISCFGTWWREGTAVDQSVNFNGWAVNCTWNRSALHGKEFETGHLSEHNGRPAIIIPWERGSNVESEDRLGEIELWDSEKKGRVSHQGVVSFPGSARSGEFVIYVDGSNAPDLNTSNSFYIVQKYTPTKNKNLTYTTESATMVTIPAYPQVLAGSLKANLDENTHRMEVSWRLKSAPSVRYLDDVFKLSITRTDSVGSQTTVQTVPYQSGITSYNYTFDVATTDKAKYSFFLTRSLVSDKDAWTSRSTFGRLLENVEANLEHVHVGNVSAELSDDEEEVVIRWDKKGRTYSAGTSFKIQRYNVTKNGTDEFILSRSEFDKGEYHDRQIRKCNTYTYKVKVTPNLTYYEDQNAVDADAQITPRKYGNISDLHVSKGYYSTYTDLRWNVDGDFDEYIIQRKAEHESEWNTIQTLPSANALSLVSTTDRSGIAGEVYNYRVFGDFRCGDEVTCSDTLYSVGFRTPTADFYGRVTFQSGQAVDSVEVVLEPETTQASGMALLLNRTDSAVVGGDIFLNNSSITLQAWVYPSEAKTRTTYHILQKHGCFDLGLRGKDLYWDVNGISLSTSSNHSFPSLETGKYYHVTATYSAEDDSIAIYVNGLHVVGRKVNKRLPNTGAPVVIGSGWVGMIDEVRMWNRDLMDGEIAYGYNHYILGNEDAMAAYYTFNYMYGNQFFDLSCTGTVFHEHHGQILSGSTTYEVPTINQLAYAGTTNADGVYSVHGVPYFGSGTAYTMIPRKGVHQFSPTSEIRFVNENAQSHTVNFVDNSSFTVSGKVVYAGGDYPVSDAYFTIDGVRATMSNGSIIYTNSDGEFSLSVPVGVHEVRVHKAGHTFAQDGRITDLDGKDRNYQDMLTGLVLEDETLVPYIGRICGGSVQEAYPVGFGLSKNNLADNMTITLTPLKSAYALQRVENIHTDTLRHRDTVSHYTAVSYQMEDIVIHVDNETGEFCAMIYPEQYNIKLGVNGYTNIPGDQSMLSVIEADDMHKEGHEGDTLFYAAKQVFCKRVEASIDIHQLAGYTPLPYFGSDSYERTTLVGEKEQIRLYDDGVYTLGLPTFEQGRTYRLKYDIYERFPYYIGPNKIDSNRIDRVPIEDALVTFANSHLVLSDSLYEDEHIYEFKVGQPEMTTVKGQLSATFIYGPSSNPTSISWENPLGNANGEAYILGSRANGTGFVTAGPNRLLCVLRDPPGSNSYSYLEKGVSFTEQTSYSGSAHEEGSETWTEEFEMKAMKIDGAVMASGKIDAVVNPVTESQTGVSAGIEHTVDYTGANSRTTTTTTTMRIQTSDDPLYVGANGDVYVGYSTNITFGSTVNSEVLRRSDYDRLGAAAFTRTYLLTDSLALVQNSGYSLYDGFGTLFAYPQVFIEQTLLPNIETLRNSLLLPPGSASADALQQMANQQGKNIYLSNVPANDPTFGHDNTYTVYYTNMSTQVDTIHVLNQYMQSWIQTMADNEKAKVSAIRMQENYSFQAGANAEYSESFATAMSSSSSWSIYLGAIVSNDFESLIFGKGISFSFEQHVGTVEGGSVDKELERSHTRGFVLAEEGDDDYLTVDVLYEAMSEDDKNVYDSDMLGAYVGSGTVSGGSLEDISEHKGFVFRTRGGATSCPYEDGDKVKYWEGHIGQQIGEPTLKLEEPMITVEQDFINNVPSGESAYLTLHMRNNSETGEDQWFYVRPIDETNPDGAIISIDGNSLAGFTLEFLVPAGDDLVKTMTVDKGRALNYDNLQVALLSRCQADPTDFLDVIGDTVTFSVHFTPSCSDVRISYPSNNWTYNTKSPVTKDAITGLDQHYLPIRVTDFDVNYADFDHIELQYKPMSASDNDWLTLAYYYNSDSLYQAMLSKGFNALMINEDDNGTIFYNFYMDNLPDQRYDLRAVTYCNINNVMYQYESNIVSGIKDMYTPRLFGQPQPADGVLDVEDDVKVQFNEPISAGMLTTNNFSVTGVRNGAVTDHSVAIRLDGSQSLQTEISRNLSGKDLTLECWAMIYQTHNATLIRQGNSSNYISLGITADRHLVVTVNGQQFRSLNTINIEAESWNHFALVYNHLTSTVTAYCNFVSAIENESVPVFSGVGALTLGDGLRGCIDNVRIWQKQRSSGTIQIESAQQLSGNEVGLIAYYPMDEARGNVTEDKARGAHLMLGGAEWILPEGYSTKFYGPNSGISLDASSSVVYATQDWTISLWFKADPNQANNATLLTNTLNNVADDPTHLLRIGMNAAGQLLLDHNDRQTTIDGQWNDNQWHQMAITVSRSHGHARVYMDGVLTTYMEADALAGMASDRLYAGLDFVGYLDEIQIWNLYKTQSQLSSAQTTKLDGTEPGLLIYWPMETYVEHQGVQNLSWSLDNQVVSRPAQGQAHGMSTRSTDIAPVRNKGAVSKLLYNYVVNNDAIIINLTEPAARIENTIVTFTLSDVRDVNGNSTESPITWSAYINRNQLTWDEQSMEVEQNEYMATSFRVGFTNHGGSIENYNVQGLPTWLTVDEQSGIINPLRQKMLTFTIDAGLNTGTYDEVIYLTNSEGVSSPLELRVVVNGARPNWDVNPADFAYNMSVIGQLYFDGVCSNDTSDQIAVVAGGECVGAAKVRYNAAMDMYYVMLTVYSNQPTMSGLIYRLWDNSEGRMYVGHPSEDIEFRKDAVYGTPIVPIVFRAGNESYQTYSLAAGWNWISLPVRPSDMSLDHVLGTSGWSSEDLIKTFYRQEELSGRDTVTAPFASYSARQKAWTGTLSAMQLNKMYMLYVDKPTTLAVTGTEVNPQGESMPAYAQNWTYIGYPCTYNMDLKTALANYDAQYGDIIKSQSGFAMYFGNEWIGSLTYMRPSEGYMIYNSSYTNKSFVYPSSGSVLHSNVQHVGTAYEHTMIAVVAAEGILPNDQLQVLVGSEVRATVPATEQGDRLLFYVSVPGGTNPQTLSFSLLRDGVQFTAVEHDTYAPNRVSGSIDQPFMLHFAGIDDSGSMAQKVLYENTIYIVRDQTIWTVDGRKVQ